LPFALERAEAQRTLHLQEPAYSLPMIGRRAELALIKEKLELALSGQGQVVVVTAEAGMGKSRLLAEAVLLARRSFTGYSGACQASGANTSYQVWKPIWQDFFDIDPNAPLKQQMQLLEMNLECLAPERKQALPLLAQCLDLPLPDNDFTRTLEPLYYKSALEALLIDCLKAAAQQVGENKAGLLLVLEDLHWLDPLSLDLLEKVIRSVADLPVLVLMAYRPLDSRTGDLLSRFSDLERLPHFTKIILDEMDKAEAAEMVRLKLAQLSATGEVDAPPTLLKRVAAQAQGNPFYLEELLNWMHDQHIDLNDPAVLQTLELPASLHNLVLSRMDQLSPHQQLILKVASVLGRVFKFAHLHGYYPALGEPGPLKAELDLLARLDLTPLESPEPELSYLFKHIITREVAYETLPHTTRAALHEQYARFLETLAGPEAEGSLLDALAYHYDLSNNLDKKRRYLQQAGKSAAALYANAAASDYFARALALCPPEDHETRWTLLAAREQALDLLGDRPAQRQTLGEMKFLAARRQDAGRQAAAALRQAALDYATGDYPPAIRAVPPAIELARLARNPALEAEGYFRWGVALWRQGDYLEARHKLGQALEQARAARDGGVEAASLRNLGNVCLSQGDYAGARQDFEQALLIYRSIGNRQGEGLTLNNLSVVCSDLGDYPGAHQYCEQALRIFSETGDRRFEGVVLGNLGAAFYFQGDYDGARGYCEQNLRIARETGDLLSECFMLYNLGLIHANQGDYAASRRRCEQAAQIARQVGAGRELGYALTGLGDALAGLEQPVQAAAAYHEALDLRRGVGHEPLTMETLAGLVRLAWAQGDHDQAQAHAETIVQYLEGGGSLNGAEEPLRIYLACYHVLHAAGDARAASLLETAHSQLQERAARIADPGQRRIFLQEVPWNRSWLPPGNSANSL
jgi:tetratricopeptide (TPR) repeat protein